MDHYSLNAEKTSLENSSKLNGKPRWRVFAHAATFVLGFSLVFIIGWGGSATLLGRLFGEYKNTLSKVGGLVVILFGLHTLEILTIPWFAYDLRPEWSKNKKLSGYSASGLMGVFFAAGWTPCVGTILGAILTLGLNQETSGQAMLLASGYAIGLGLPFLALGLGIERANQFLVRFRRRVQIIQKISGVLLLLLGVLIMTNQLTMLAIWAQKTGLYLSLPLNFTATPTYLVSIAAGLLSFLSPCVIPLVPAYLGYLSGHAVGDGSWEVAK
jgi:cytochrome c-type biogenesis protein